MAIDIELAVALEMGALQLERAVTRSELAKAQTYNRELWQTIGQLAEDVPARQPDAETQAARNRLLAARAVHPAALNRLLAAWASHASLHPRAEFGLWLLEQIRSNRPAH